MNCGRLGTAVLFVCGLWVPAAGIAAPLPARQTGGRTGPVFSPGGDWARAEVSALIGSQLVNQTLGFSRNIFQTVSARVEDVGFGEHRGGRGVLFLNRYLGVEAGFTRTRTEFELSVADEEGGVTVFAEPLIQESRETTVAVVAQLPLAAMTPYGTIGHVWRSSEVEGSDPFRSGAFVVGGGIKVPFPRLPLAAAFDYRYARYPGGDEMLYFTEGTPDGSTVSSLTLGVVFRFGLRP